MKQLLQTLACMLCFSGLYAQNENIQLQINGSKPGPELSPYLYGLFFEDINFGADGGIYAELVQNRSFEYYPVRGELNQKGYELTPFTAWERLYRDGAKGDIIVTKAFPLNKVNRNNLEIRVSSNEGSIGVANSGFDGIPLKSGDNYIFSVFARRELRGGERHAEHLFIVQLENTDGKIIASDTLPDISDSWEKYETLLTPDEDAPDAKLVILNQGRGRTQIDMVSLFPEKTFNKRKNGLRKDLIESIDALNPTFLRFPGGCIAHGWGIDNVYNWKETLGKPEERTPNWNRWGYHQTYGLGYYEYFLLCEDLGATPLPVIPVGVSCSYTHYECVPMENMDKVIQDGLDLVEFANGSVDTEWGKVRAEMGHPEPFNLRFVCLGNEEGDRPQLHERFPLVAKAFKEKYPDIKLIGNSGLSPEIPLYNLMDETGMHSSDEHYYMKPEWYIENQSRFDDWDRSKPKVFVGEYASLGNKLYNAVAEAVYLTGVERNADVVEMASYAPLFARYGHIQWSRANLIYFDNQQVVKTVNYHVQQMFSLNKGDVYINSEIQNSPGDELAVSNTYDNSNGELIIKLVNASDKSETLHIQLAGFKSIGKKSKQILLTGNKDDENKRDNPEKVKPAERLITTGKTFSCEAPAYSVQVIRIKAKR